jgi:O-antigen biosynthesis protein
VALRRRARTPLLVTAEHEAVGVLAREGPAPLEPGSGRDADGALRLAFVVPWFRRGSGGHQTIVNLVRELQARGHTCSLWLHDPGGRHAAQSDAQVAASFAGFFGAAGPPLRRGFAGWDGTDVVIATGWQTVHRTLLLAGCGARAYLVQDHEPEFYGASAERLWAEETYRLGLHAVAASPWLAGLMRARYGSSAAHFDLGVDHEVYRPLPVQRREDVVLFYARAATPRRAVPLGLLALEELHRRRPDVEIALFGDAQPLPTPFPHRRLGVLDHVGLARAHSSATVGLVLSLTNPSLLPTEMLACGLAVVDIASESMLATFGPGGPIELAEPNPAALAAALERLLDDPALRAQRAARGRRLVAGRTWQAAAEQVQAGLREALRATR